MLSNPSPIANWAGIVGIWKFDADRASYIKPDPRIPFGFGIAISSANLRNGSIRTTIDLSANPQANEARISLAIVR